MHQLARRGILRAARGATVLSFFVAMGFSFHRQGEAQTVAQQALEMQPAEQVFKNIQVLQGMRAGDLQGAMSFIAGSLGVDCDYCHTQAFESDKQPAKLRAREMIRMVRRANQETFRGQDIVNCFTCYQGRTLPVSISPILPPAPKPAAAPATATGGTHTEPLPSVQVLLDRYVQALGGPAGLDQVKSRVVKTGRLTGETSDSTTELFQKAPGKVLVVYQSPGYSFWVGFNGQQAWAEDSIRSYWGLLNTAQRNQIMRDSELYQGSRLRSQYSNVIVVGREKIGDHDTYVVAGTSPEGTHERFSFDAQTGLLLRRHIEEQTILGWFPVEADFEDYREVNGIKTPFVVRWSSAGGAWGVRTSSKVLEVQVNVAIGDERFDHPPSKQ